MTNLCLTNTEKQKVARFYIFLVSIIYGNITISQRQTGKSFNLIAPSFYKMVIHSLKNFKVLLTCIWSFSDTLAKVTTENLLQLLILLLRNAEERFSFYSWSKTVSKIFKQFLTSCNFTEKLIPLKIFSERFYRLITILFCFTFSIQRRTEATQNNALETYLTFTDVSITKLFIWKLEQFGYCMVLISTCYALHVTKFKVVLWQHFMLINVASFCSFHHW